MMELKALLAEQGIRKVVVIDDTFDETPQVDEMSEADWPTFFDDLSVADTERLSEKFPQYDDTNVEDLKESQDFISFLWYHRQLFKGAQELFGEYENRNKTELAALEKLVSLLNQWGLECIKMGRKINNEVWEADLFIVDLFLGLQQSDLDSHLATKIVADIVKRRSGRLPLVILMSSSYRLKLKSDDFRDCAGLLSTAFRVLTKQELLTEGVLSNALFRLATHLTDANRVAMFIQAWENGLMNARERFVRLLRRLDLPDLAQIHALLLQHEGQEIGEYLLDVADKVLQFEIEGQAQTISASLELNKIDITKYPAPHILGSSGLQELVYRMIFLNPNRLKLSETDKIPEIHFGDVLRWVNENSINTHEKVSVVVTPACDLVRQGSPSILLVSGTLKKLKAMDWKYDSQSVRTPISILEDGTHNWVKWNLKDVQTLDRNNLRTLLEENRLQRIARLRELYTLEIQQKLLADFGRVGQIAPLPAQFPALVSFFFVGRDNTARLLIDDDIETVVYSGRTDSSKPERHLIISEQDCDRIWKSVANLPSEEISQRAADSLNAIKEDKFLFSKFERGEVHLPDSIDCSPKPLIKSADNRRVFVMILSNPDFRKGFELSGEALKSPLIVNITFQNEP